jgi:hypothetical protein
MYIDFLTQQRTVCGGVRMRIQFLRRRKWKKYFNKQRKKHNRSFAMPSQDRGVSTIIKTHLL